MRKVKTTALLGAFVAIAGVTAISHEAGATQITATVNTYAKELYQGNISVSNVLLTPSVNASGATIVLSLQNATFTVAPNIYYGPASSDTLCTAPTLANPTSSVTLTGCSLTANASYTVSTGPGTVLSISSVNNSPAILTYSSNVTNDTQSSATVTNVVQQLSVSSITSNTYVINPASLTSFQNSNNNNQAANSVVLNDASGYSTWTYYIKSGTLSFVFSGIPNSVTQVSGSASYGSDGFSSATTFGNGSTTVSVILNSGGLLSTTSDTYTFTFSNSGNIQPANITLNSIIGSVTSNATGISNSSYSYLSNPQLFMTWLINGVQIYVPDALVPYNGNAITAGYITISMPSSASIAGIQILNNTSASCNATGLLTPTGLANQYYINLANLPSACTGVSGSAWQSGVPLVITVSAQNGVLPSQVAADGYAVIQGYGLKRLPTNVINSTSPTSYSQFPY